MSYNISVIYDQVTIFSSVADKYERPPSLDNSFVNSALQHSIYPR